MVTINGNGSQYLITSASIPLPTGAAPGALNVVANPMQNPGNFLNSDYFAYGAQASEEIRGIGEQLSVNPPNFIWETLGNPILGGNSFTLVPTALSYNYNGTTLTGYQDGGVVGYHAVTLATAYSALGVFTRSNKITQPLTGSIFECIAFTSDLSASQLDLLSTNQSRFYW
jgi:hypothetical protein